MPSQWHEALVLLFRNRPELAPELVRDVLHVNVPAYRAVLIDSADFTELKVAEYRADLVVLLLEGAEAQGAKVGGMIVEIQRAHDDDKPFSWPCYCTLLRARIRRDVWLLVVTPDEAVARWASTPIHLGGGNWFVPLVLGPSAIPEITDEAVARRDPELAVLSAMAHGRDTDVHKAAQIAAAALAASLSLDADRTPLYGDVTWAALSEGARQELQAMDPAKYEYQSEFAKRYISLGKEQGKAEGKAEGEAEGRAHLLRHLLTLRFGALPPAVLERLSAASIDELDAIGERLLTAPTLDDTLRPR